MQTQNNREVNQDRVVFLELLRIFAAFFVIVNHTNSQIFQACGPSVLWYVSVAWFCLSRTAVPVFVMITGYLMLHRQYTYRKVVQSALRILGCLLVFSGVYYGVDCISGDITRPGPGDFLERLLTGDVNYALWYLYMYLGLLIMLPFLQKIAAGMGKRDYHVFFGISGLIVSVWPMVTHLISGLTVSEDFALPLFGGYICLLLAGAYMRKYVRPGRKGRPTALAVIALMCAAGVVLTRFEYIRTGGQEYLFFADRLLLPTVAASIGLFCFAATLNPGEMLSKWIAQLGGLTFGIYLVSDLAIDGLLPVWNLLRTSGMHVMVGMVVYEILIFVISGLLAFVLKRIPLVGKLL